MLFQTRKSFVRLRNTIEHILDENREVCDCPIDCQVNTTVKAQKSMKGIVKIVHLPSVVLSELYEATIILFVRKENKNNDLFNNLSHLRHCSAILENIRWTQTAYAVLCQPHHTDMLFSFKSKRKERRRRIRVAQLTQNSVRSFHPKYLKLCSEDEPTFYGFGMTWG